MLVVNNSLQQRRRRACGWWGQCFFSEDELSRKRNSFTGICIVMHSDISLDSDVCKAAHIRAVVRSKALIESCTFVPAFVL